MPIDPQIRQLVDRVNAAAAKAPPIWEQTVEERRLGYRILSKRGGPGPEVKRVEHATVDGVPVRIYTAADAAGGAFVFLHGGGHVIGDVDTHDPVCRQLARAATTTVISVDYRLAPEHPFPAGFEDAWKVVRAVHDERRGRGERVVVGGDSAGGNLAAAVAIEARDQTVDLAAQIFVYPSIDASSSVAGAAPSSSYVRHAEGFILTAETIAWFRGHHMADPTDWRASPILAQLHGVAPALIITAEFDPLHDDGGRYAAALRDAGVRVEHVDYDGMPHTFFQFASFVDAGGDAVRRVAATVRAALDGVPVSGTSQSEGSLDR